MDKENVVFVSVDEMSTIEHYAASLIFGVYSIKTLEAFHVKALKLGLLNEDEEESVKTICWEMKRLIALHKTQLDQITEKSGFNQEKAMEYFRKVFPDE